MSFANIYLHIVLRTKNGAMAIDELHEGELYAYMIGFINNCGGKSIRIGGMPDHVHILTSVPVTVAFSDFIRNLKVSSSKFIHEKRFFPYFRGWGEGYAAFSCSMCMLQRTVDYINNQKEHHKTVSFTDEYRAFILENGGKIDERFFMKD